MKANRLLRVLTLFGFLLLFAPFYDSCNDEVVETVDDNGNPVKVHEEVTVSLFDVEPFNGFEIASFSYFAIKETSFHDIKEELSKTFTQKNWYKDLGIIVSFLFDFIVLISFSMFVLTFTKKMKLTHKLALINCILVIVTLLYIVCLEKSFEHWRQIKWGYYVFIITNLLIFYYSKNDTKIVNPKS